MSKVSVRARDIVGFARRNNITISNGSTGYDNKACARSIVAMMALGLRYDSNNRPNWEFPSGIYSDGVNQAVGLTNKQAESLEIGFENWDVDNYPKNYINKRYYRVGRNVARLAGLS